MVRGEGGSFLTKGLNFAGQDFTLIEKQILWTLHFIWSCHYWTISEVKVI